MLEKIFERAFKMAAVSTPKCYLAVFTISFTVRYFVRLV